MNKVLSKIKEAFTCKDVESLSFEEFVESYRDIWGEMNLQGKITSFVQLRPTQLLNSCSAFRSEVILDSNIKTELLTKDKVQILVGKVYKFSGLRAKITTYHLHPDWDGATHFALLVTNMELLHDGEYGL